MQNTASQDYSQISPYKIPVKGDSCACERESLDKSKQLDKNTSDLSETQLSDLKHWHTKQENKTLSDHVAYSLLSVVDENNPMFKAYARTLACSREITLENGAATTVYCGNRWCLTCNRIRTAVNIDGYYKPVKAMEKPQFVTLTFKAIPSSEIIEKIQDPFDAWRSVMRAARYKYKKTESIEYKLSGVRKVEANYNPDKDWFNVHFHVIIDRESSAQYLVEQWMKFIQKKGYEAVRTAQDVRPVAQSADALKEMFKYVTKVFSGIGEKRSKKQTEAEYCEEYQKLSFYPEAMHLFYSAMRNKRTIQPFGGVAKVNDEVDELNLESQSLSFLPSDQLKVYTYCPERMGYYCGDERMIHLKMTYKTRALIKSVPFDRSKIPIYQSCMNYSYYIRSVRHVNYNQDQDSIPEVANQDLKDFFINLN